MKRKRWTDEEDTELKRLAQKYRAAEIAERLGRSVAATMVRAHQLRVSLRMPERKKQGEMDGAPAGTDLR
jgi:DNA-directed RNA polymerase specialized sigma24 family protein